MGLPDGIEILGDDTDTLILNGAWEKGSASNGLIVYTIQGTDPAVSYSIAVHPDVQVVSQISGGADSDNLAGSGSGDLMFGGEGDDTLVAGAGNDTVTGGVGNDSILGGDGIDTIDFSQASTPLNIE